MTGTKPGCAHCGALSVYGNVHLKHCPEIRPTPPPPSETAKMTKYRRRNRTIEAITFDELVEYGIASGAELHRGMPWSFQYRGYPITHENDDCYLIPAPGLTMRFNRGDMLVVEKHQIYPLPPATFAYFYEPAGPDVL